MKEQLERAKTFMDVLREAREKCNHEQIPKKECPHCLLGPDSMRFVIEHRESYGSFLDDFPEWEGYVVVYESPRFTLGTYNLWPSEIRPEIPKGQTPAPVYAYVHSGTTLSLGAPANKCPWDSGQSGYIFGPDSEEYAQVLKDLQAWINGELYHIVEEHLNPLTNEWEFYMSNIDCADYSEAEKYIADELTEK